MNEIKKYKSLDEEIKLLNARVDLLLLKIDSMTELIETMITNPIWIVDENITSLKRLKDMLRQLDNIKK